ncbi:MAG: cytochrome c peroxidase [Phycisphaerales bacterium]|jgi:cytochrome c peroxidase|nr:cytochrome c peroxidase [Phycisphaerales bacterium]
MSRVALILPALALLLPGCGGDTAPTQQEPSRTHGEALATIGLDDERWARVRSMAEIPPLPPDPTNRVADDPRAVELGHRLFFDSRLSGTGKVSCATCHDPEQDFTDGLPVAVGVGVNQRNAPTILNSGYHRWLTWDGRADSLWAQALEPMENDVEMGGDRLDILRTVSADPELRERYESMFGPLPDLADDDLPEHARPRRDGGDDVLSRAWSAIPLDRQEAITSAFVNLGKSLGAYQRRLVSANAPFDRFVDAVESGAIESDGFSPQAIEGLTLFVGEAGCWECHAGPMLTTGAFHDIGVPPVAGGMPTDSGRFAGADVVGADVFNAAGPHSDRTDGTRARLVRSLVNSPDNWGRFRTPSLREVSRTAPYMHEGRFKSLEEVVRFYSTLEGAVQLDHHQETMLTPLNLTPAQQAALVAFLETLDGSPNEPDLARPPVKTELGP